MTSPYLSDNEGDNDGQAQDETDGPTHQMPPSLVPRLPLSGEGGRGDTFSLVLMQAEKRQETSLGDVIPFFHLLSRVICRLLQNEGVIDSGDQQRSPVGAESDLFDGVLSYHVAATSVIVDTVFTADYRAELKTVDHLLLFQIHQSRVEFLQSRPHVGELFPYPCGERGIALHLLTGLLVLLDARLQFL